MCDGFDQCHVGLKDIFENILGIAGSRDPQHLQFRILRLDLAAQILEHFDSVLNGIAV